MFQHIYLAIKVQLLHILITVSDADKCAKLSSLFGFALLEHLLPLPPPTFSEQVDAGWRAKEPLLVPVRFLSHFRVQDNQSLISSVTQILLHCLSKELNTN